MRPLVAEPFCGAGGMTLGLKRAGFQCYWAGEKDKYAAATHRAAHHTTLIEQELDGSERFHYEPTLLAGGPPCQPFSNAGYKLGAWDPRDGFPAILEYLDAYRPKAVLLENVKGLTSPRHQHYLDAIRRTLHELGYFVPTSELNDGRIIPGRVLQAADFGVPQKRERLFIVAFLDSNKALRFRWPAPTHSLEALVLEKQTAGWPEEALSRQELAALKRIHRHRREPAAVMRCYLKRWRTVRDAIGDLVEELADIGREGTPGRKKSLLHKLQRPDEPANTVSAAAESKSSEHKLQVALQVKNGRYRTSERSLDEPCSTVAASWAKEPPQITIRRSNGPERTTVERGIDHPSTAITTENVGQGVVRNLGAGDGLDADPDSPAPTVPASKGGTMGLALYDANSVHTYVGSEGTSEPGRVHKRPNTVIRRLSIREVARLQTFPDDYPWQGPVTSQYRQIGNAVPPLLAEVIGRSVKEALEG